MEANSGQKSPRLRERQKAQTRAMILDAARSLFYRFDVGKVGISQIADAAGVGRQTFYFHFRDKDDLIAQLVADYNFRGAEVMQRFPGPLPTKDALRGWILEFAEFLKELKVEYSILFQLSHHPSTCTTYGRPTVESWVAALAERAEPFAAATLPGQEGERARARAWLLIVGMTWAASAWWQQPDTPFADEAVATATGALYDFLANSASAS